MRNYDQPHRLVYDRKTGDILQVHHFSAMPGANLPETDKLHEMVLQQSVRHDHAGRSRVEILQIEPGEMKSGIFYRASVKERKLVEKRSGRASKPRIIA